MKELMEEMKLFAPKEPKTEIRKESYDERDEIMEEIKKIDLQKPAETQQKTRMSFFEKHQKPLFFLLFISSTATGLCFIALLLL